MAYELKDGQGSFFRNDKKPEGSKQPDYRGELMLGGVLHEVAGWIKEGNRGKWMSLSVKVKETTAPAEQQPTAPAIDDDSSVPF